MLIGLLHFEDHRNLREERVVLDLLEVLAGLEHHPVFTRFKRLFGREQFGNSPLFIGRALSQWLPVLANVFLQCHIDTRRRQAVFQVEHVHAQRVAGGEG
ncbi:hypothetical protein D3C74_465490 [compost metagenome]